MSTRSATARKPAASPRRRTPVGRPAGARRVSGPAGGIRAARASAATAVAPRTVGVARPSLPGLRLVDATRDLSVSGALRGALQGRGWIALLTVLLLGIVFMQVHMLKLNAGISRAVETAGTLERQNAQLRQDVSQLSAADRIAQTATALGMVMPQPGSVRYLGVTSPAADARRAVKTMTAPAPPAATTGVAATITPVPPTSAPAAPTPAAATPVTAAVTPAPTPAADPVPVESAPAAIVAPAPDPVGAPATAAGGVTPVQP